MGLTRQPPDDGPARDPAVDRHRAEDGHAAPRAALHPEAHRLPGGRHLHLLVERPARVARPVPDPRRARHRGAALQGAARPGAEGPLPGRHPGRRGASSPRTSCARRCAPRPWRPSTTSSCGRRASSSSRKASSPSSSTWTCRSPRSSWRASAAWTSGSASARSSRRPTSRSRSRTTPAYKPREPAERRALELVAAGQDAGRDQPGAAPLASSTRPACCSTCTAGGVVAVDQRAGRRGGRRPGGRHPGPAGDRRPAAPGAGATTRRSRPTRRC